MALRAHQKPNKGDSDVWLTPRWILDSLGEFALDPCAAPDPRPWDTAKTHYTEAMDGLSREWFGRVWLNPPFSQKEAFFDRMVEHGNGIALTPASTETDFFRRFVWDAADGALFLNRRPYFHTADGTRGPSNSGQAIVLVAYGKSNARVLERLPDIGRFVR